MRAHEIAAVDAIDGGHVLRCSCGWGSTALARSALVEGWMRHRKAPAGSPGVALAPPEPAHGFVAAVEVHDGYRIECACGWTSGHSADALGMFDAWERHCEAPDSARS